MITNILDTLLVLVGIVGIIIAYTQLKALGKQIKEQNIWNKKDATFKYLEKYDENFKKIANSLNILLENQSIEEVLKDKRAEIINLVTYFDNLALGIKADYFDEYIAERSLLLQSIMVYDELTKHRYFDVRKKEVGNEVAAHFRNLMLKWKQNQVQRILKDYE